MKFVGRGREGIRKILTECLALLFLLADRRVRWYAKFAVLLPLGYIASPIDLIPDGLLFFGRMDDLIIVRAAYALLKRIVGPARAKEIRAREDGSLTFRKGVRAEPVSYFNPLLPGFTGVLPALHIGQTAAS